MEFIFGVIDPSTLAGLSVVCVLGACVISVYLMRDPTPLPRYVARRLECPHRRRKFTVELLPAPEKTVHYCSAFAYGDLRCDQACASKA